MRIIRILLESWAKRSPISCIEPPSPLQYTPELKIRFSENQTAYGNEKERSEYV
jgi:hypothetical protein